MSEFEEKGKAIGNIVKEKNIAYGDSFAKAGNVLREMYPNGIKPNQYDNMLYIVRCLDKFFRIATNENAFEENPAQDVAGYSILKCVNDDKK